MLRKVKNFYLISEISGKFPAVYCELALLRLDFEKILLSGNLLPKFFFGR